MIIKHFAGYGRVNARKIGKIRESDGIKRIRIEVTGNHEQGLTRPFHDDSLIRTWLLEKFDKSIAGIPPNRLKVRYTCEDSQHVVDGVITEMAIYDIEYGERPAFGW